MKIINEQTTFLRKVKEYDIEAFGKTITVSKLTEDDNIQGYDNNIEIISKKEYDALSEEQRDEFDDFVYDLT